MIIDYSYVKGIITVPNTSTTDAAPNKANKEVIIKNFVPFTNCISKINNTQVHNAKDIDVVISMYSLIEYGDNYSKTTERLWQYYRDEPTLNNSGVIIDFPEVDNSIASFKFKQKITAQTGNDGTKDVEIMVPLRYLSSFQRAPEMPLTNCKINLILTWSANVL